jgi:acyl-coenzyme A synthetase/AMP-(fatty) acid ligase
MSPGYWANEEETNERFVRDPLDSRMPQTWYRTGDLLRERPDGLYEYVGRVDNQVKIRGHRVELGEVEVVLHRHESVAEAAVVAWHPYDKPNEGRLVAYVAGRQGATPENLRIYLEARLPRYMVPAQFIIESLPLPRNANGKIDRRALANRLAQEMV